MGESVTEARAQDTPNQSSDNPLPVVDLVVRSDGLTKPGGDVLQAHEYAIRLRKLGFDVQLVEFRIGLTPREGAIVHYFNIDRPYELFELKRRLHSSKYYISTIHHAEANVQRMRVHSRSDNLLRNLVSSKLSEPTYLLAAYCARCARDSTVSRTVLVGAILRAVYHRFLFRLRVRSVLNKANAVFVLSQIEREALIADFGWRAANCRVTPNGRPNVTLSTSSSRLERNGILAVGRIESRKRMLELAEQCDKMKVPIVVVGSVNENEPRYVAKFRDCVSSTDSVKWLGALPHEQVLELFGGARVLVNSSWVEVQSLVDIEAATAGCWIVTLKNGGASKEYLGDAVVEVDSIGDAVRIAANLDREGTQAPQVGYAHTWEACVRTIADAYGLDVDGSRDARESGSSCQ